MIKLSKEDRTQLRKAMLSAYPDPGELDIFVFEGLGENLAAIAGGNNHTQVTFNLIRWAVSKERIDDLILKLAQDTQNSYVQAFCKRILPQYLNLNDATAASSLPLTASLDEWELDVVSEELQLFLPKQYSFEADVGDLRRGLDLGNAVCRITFSDDPDNSGTGVLIAPDLVLTNYHVLSLDAEANHLNDIAQSMRFHFGDVSAQLGQRAQAGAIAPAKDAIIQASPIHELDYVLLRLAPNDRDLDPVPFDADIALSKQSPLSILQHPEGDRLKVSLSNNGIVKTNEQRGLVLYVNRTKGGSSGAPCFNSEWKLVALHHKELATSFGSVREGVLFSAIYPQIASFL